MTEATREQAFFGGWRIRPVAGGTVAWGPPHWRVQEFQPSAITTVVLPTADRAGQRGVPLWVLNRGTAQLVVRRPSDNAVIWTLAAGSAACFVLGADWHGWPLASVQFGSVFPGLRYLVDVSVNTANLNILERVVAQGYDGVQPAAVTCTIRAGAAIGTTDRLLRAVTTGGTFGGVSWAAGSRALLVVEANAIVGGWGGKGGRGGAPGTGAAAGQDGENGGQAIRAEIPLLVDCHGLIFGGGGGGGGGGSSTTQPTVIGGGGGGGRGANMTTGGVLIGSQPGGATAPAGIGDPGGSFIAGGRGPGPLPPEPPDPLAWQSGLGVGGGGNGGTGGATGSLLGGIGFTGTAAVLPGGGPGAAGGLGGQPGAAISYLPAAGAPNILAGSANILGATVAEAF